MSADSAPERVDYLAQQLIDFHTELVRVKLRLAAPPVDGKANEAIIKALAKHFKTRVRMISGQTSRRKIFEVGDN